MNLNKFYSKLTAKQAAFIAVFFWATNYPATKYALVHTDVNTLAVLRYTIAGVILFFLGIKKNIPLPKLSEIPKFFFVGFIGFSAYFVIFNIAMTKITSSTASVINALTPALTALLAFFIFKEKIRALGWFSLFISFIGVTIMTLWNGVLSVNNGIFIVLFAYLMLSIYNICQRGLSKKYSSFQIIIYSMILGSIQLLVYSPKSLLKIAHLDLSVLLVIIYMAVFPAVVSYMLWTRAFEIAKSTTEVTTFMFCSPILTAIISAITIGEIPDISTFIGGAIVISGMILFSKTK
ncbi:MAG: DMT family transporter [Fusobacterium sp.]|nr:DMT family transporter [Fusobacterium sp.]